MSKWEEEFITTHKDTARLREFTRQWKKISPAEAEKVKEMMKRFERKEK